MFRRLFALAFVGFFTMAAASRAEPPPVAPAPPPIEAYGKLPAMEMVRLSPSGDRYAFVADDGQARRLFVLTTDNKPLEIANIGQQKLVGVEWAGEDFVLVELSSTVDLGPDYVVGKTELSTVIVLDLKTHKQKQVFAGRSDVQPAVFGTYGTAEIKGRWYGYFGGETLERDADGGGLHSANTVMEGSYEYTLSDLYRVDLQTGDIRLVAKAHELGQDWLLGPDGAVVARSFFNSRSGKWWVAPGAFGGQPLASGVNKFGGPDLLGLGRTPDAILIRRGDNDGWVTEQLPLAGGPAKTVVDARSNDGVIEDPTTGFWIGTATQADDPTYTLFSPLFDARLRGARKAFPGYRVALKSWSQDFNRMIVFTDGKDDAGTYWIVDIAKKSADVLGEAYPSVSPSQVGPVRMVDYKAADGLALRGVLTLPPGREAKNLPLVVMPHGGPWARDYPGFDYWAQAFASRGYAVFQPNFRASSGYGQALYEAGYGEWGRKMQTDISDGAAELVRQGIVNPKRACIVGWSYGGYAAQAGITLQHGLYRCAVSMAGVSDLDRMLQYVGDETELDGPATRGWKLFLGVKSSWRGARDISPAKHADKADAPILLIHGKDDTVVPIEQSDIMERALRAAGKPVERLTLTGADHWLLREETRVSMVKASVAFVEKYSPPDPK